MCGATSLVVEFRWNSYEHQFNFCAYPGFYFKRTWKIL